MDLTTLRRTLHRRAAPAFQEAAAAETVRDWLSGFGLEPVADDVAGHGLLYRFGSGRRVLLRADLDALPWPERTGLAHAGTDATHACGHDGHMAMLAGALARLVEAPPCEVWALFQPAEETGAGMAQCLEDPRLAGPFDACFAVHNVPGHPLGVVLVREGTAAVASTGITVRFQGTTSHAAEPRLGRNPIPAMARLVPEVLASPRAATGPAVAALVEARAGGPNFGTSAGDAALSMTLRADTDEALEAMIAHVIGHARALADADGLELGVERVEPFPATPNHGDAVAAVRSAAKSAGLEAVAPDRPFAWSEDFGHLAARWPGALVGLGAGTDHPPLHSEDYDFPDDLLEPGVRFWCALAEAA